MIQTPSSQPPKQTSSLPQPQASLYDSLESQLMSHRKDPRVAHIANRIILGSQGEGFLYRLFEEQEDHMFTHPTPALFKKETASVEAYFAALDYYLSTAHDFATGNGLEMVSSNKKGIIVSDIDFSVLNPIERIDALYRSSHTQGIGFAQEITPENILDFVQLMTTEGYYLLNNAHSRVPYTYRRLIEEKN